MRQVTIQPISHDGAVNSYIGTIYILQKRKKITLNNL